MLYEFSFYNHDRLTREVFELRPVQLMKILNDFVLMLDIFFKVNGMINVSDSNKNSFWIAENNFNMLQTLLKFVKIECEDHN